MIKQIYCIFDKKSGFYTPELILLDNDEVAKRWFDSYLNTIRDNNPNAPIVMYPSDFELMSLGTFDFYDAITSVYDCPRSVASAFSFIIK